MWVDFTPGNADILYRRSTDGGSSFTESIKNLSSNPGGSFPAIAVSGNNVHVVWDDNTPGNFEILYRRSINGGSTFPNVIKNLSNNPGSSSAPEIAVSEDNVHVVWQDNTPGNNDILYRRSLDGGTTFPNVITNLSDNAGGSAFPAVAVSGSNVYVVWEDDMGSGSNFEILYRPSADNGVTFDPTITNISTNEVFSNFPSIAISS